MNANHNVTSRVQVNAMVGGNLRREQFRSDSTRTAGLSVPDIYNVRNAAITPLTNPARFPELRRIYTLAVCAALAQ